MQIGISTSTNGRLAGPAAVRAVAAAAEQLGYASFWVVNEPPLPADQWGPSHFDLAGVDLAELDPAAFDPARLASVGLHSIPVLAAAAAVTATVRIGTAITVEPGPEPTDLVRVLLSLDSLSDGRLTVGLGPGSGPGPGGAPLESVLDGLDRAERRPGVLLSAADLTGLEHLAGRTDGWHARRARLDRIASEWDRVSGLTWLAAARPALVVPAPVELTEYPLSWSRAPYRGDLHQVADDLDLIRRAGADEVVLGVQSDVGLDQTLDVYARLAEELEQRLPLH